MSTAGPFVTLVMCDKFGMLNPGAIGAQQLSELFVRFLPLVRKWRVEGGKIMRCSVGIKALVDIQGPRGCMPGTPFFFEMDAI